MATTAPKRRRKPTSKSRTTSASRTAAADQAQQEAYARQDLAAALTEIAKGKGMGAMSVLETLTRIREGEGLAAAREAARKMLLASIAKRRASFDMLAVAVCVLEAE